LAHLYPASKDHPLDQNTKVFEAASFLFHESCMLLAGATLHDQHLEEQPDAAVNNGGHHQEYWHVHSRVLCLQKGEQTSRT
tara:strand:+ start:364 stop:606 length:243 start_codon:yes stop_codon:yes gene_type:complete